jgi:hypothetical protein
MRAALLLIAAIGFVLPAYAQSATGPTTTTHHTRLTMQQRFEQANATHDGHLTLDQAKAGYKAVARHFEAMDQDKKGYVTEADIHAYYKTQRALHHQAVSNNTSQSAATKQRH